jgi:multidrug transporter EmrE-like cation transporter
MIGSLLLVLLWVLVATYGDICFKQAATIASLSFAQGFVSYAACSFLALAAFQRQQWGWVFIVWNCLSLVLSMVLSVLLFQEELTSRRLVATVLVCVAILLAE